MAYDTQPPAKPLTDAGTELRRRLGLSEPSYLTHPGPQYRTPVLSDEDADYARDRRETAEIALTTRLMVEG